MESEILELNLGFLFFEFADGDSSTIVLVHQEYHLNRKKRIAF